MQANPAMLKVAIQAVRLGSLIASKAQKDCFGKSISKSDASPVTVADFAVQAAISHVLLQSYPSIRLLAEEDDNTFQKLPEEARKEVCQRVVEFVPDLLAYGDKVESKISALIGRGDYCKANNPNEEERESVFVLDPIDGTKGFLRGEQYAICLGFLEKDGKASIGVLGCPNLPEGFDENISSSFRGFLFEALLNEGARIRKLFLEKNEGDEVLRDLSLPKPTPERIIFTESYESSHTIPGLYDLLFREFNIDSNKDVIRIDSQSKFALLARGDAQVYPRLTPFDQCIWDVLPGYVLLVESGGLVTDIDGNSIDFLQGRTVKCNRIVSTCFGKDNLHQKVIALIKNAEQDIKSKPLH